MKASDIGSSFFLVVLGGFMAWQAERLSLGVPRAPGPGFFPFCLGLLLIGVALIIFAQGLKQKTRPRESDLNKGRVILTMAVIFVYPFILEPLGYLLSTFSIMILLLRMMAKKAWWFVLAIASFTSVFSYILFKVWLKVLLPGGLFGF